MKKPDYVNASFFHNLHKYKRKTKVYCRNTSLLPKALHKNFFVHNGLRFISVMISEEIIGHKLGEFAQSRRRYFFKKKKQKTKKK
jgi:small subunit ribosomal protein S19